ncbi:peptidylprolyl isomerase [bacterium]|nr:peptidylprolyl isomerase [bacterium]
MLRKIFLVTLSFLFLGGSLPKAEIVEKILAKVDDQIITLIDLKEKLAQNPLTAQAPFDQIPEDVKKQVLNLILEEKLILKEAKEKGIVVLDKEVEAVIENVRKQAGGQEKFEEALTLSGITIEELEENYREELTKQKVVRKEIAESIKIDPAKLREAYEKIKTQIRASHILVKTEEEAKDVLLKLKSGDDFDSLAKSVSICPSAQKGGDMGFFSRGQMVKEFEEAAFLLSDTQPLSGIVQTQFGYHIIKFEERKELSKEEMAQKIGMIEEQIRQEEFLKKYKEWMDGLKEKAYIKIM